MKDLKNWRDRTDKMAHQVKEIVAKPVDLNLVPET